MTKSHMQAVKTEGIYADGLVTLQPLPEEMHGPDAGVDVRLRRLLDGVVLSDNEVTEYSSKELLKVGATCVALQEKDHTPRLGDAWQPLSRAVDSHINVP